MSIAFHHTDLLALLYLLYPWKCHPLVMNSYLSCILNLLTDHYTSLCNPSVTRKVICIYDHRVWIWTLLSVVKMMNFKSEVFKNGDNTKSVLKLMFYFCVEHNRTGAQCITWWVGMEPRPKRWGTSSRMGSTLLTQSLSPLTEAK